MIKTKRYHSNAIILFHSKQQFQDFIDQKYSILAFSSPTIKRSPAAIEQAKTTKAFYFAVKTQAVRPSSLLGYQGGVFGTFTHKQGAFPFKAEPTLSDSFSKNLAEQLIQEVLNGESEGIDRIAPWVYTLLQYLQQRHRCARGGQITGIGHFKLKKITTFIQQHVEEEIRTQQLAEILGLSVFHFIRMFKKSVGETPRQYVNRIKMEKAKDMLLRTNLSITQICYETGFSSPSHFSRVFHQAYGHTPLKFRNQTRS
ncbi:MAG: helix-turn-helix domain-containing protein [Saprospiraceae bacterium]|nr:helix-turn-helix domain-containing protein [Saprospiraceae bacterium]